MEILPAIDLKNGRAVRLLQGRADRETVYYDNPLVPARLWQEAGASWLHVVDLDGAFSGQPQNWKVVERLLDIGLKIELGGGLRDLQTIGEALDRGVTRVVVGTKAVEGDEFLQEAAERFGGDRIAIGIDASNGKVAVRGWVSTTDVTPIELARRVEATGIQTIIYTDISRDGMLSGPNFEGQQAMAEAVSCNIIASGGVGSISDVQQLVALAQTHPNLSGVIIGKAVYEKRLDLAEAIRLAQ